MPTLLHLDASPLETSISGEFVDEGMEKLCMGAPITISSLKLRIDQIVRGGRTFSYGADGAKGLLQGRKATLLVASGGVYSPGSPAAAMNFVDPYMKAVLAFIGITDVQTIAVGGAAQLASGAVDRTTLLQPALEQIRSAAA